MIINNFYLLRLSFIPLKNNTPLIIYPDTVIFNNGFTSGNVNNGDTFNEEI